MLTLTFGAAGRPESREVVMRKLNWAAVVVIALLAAVLAGCGRSAEPADSGGGQRTVGIAMPTKSSERWVADGQNMVDQFHEMGYQTDLQYGDDVVQN